MKYDNKEYVIFYKYIKYDDGHMGFSGKSYECTGYVVKVLTTECLKDLGKVENEVENLIKKEGNAKRLKITGIMEIPNESILPKETK
jgi:hypothetical protein